MAKWLAVAHPADVIVTHAQNPHGVRRVYLGGKSSLECWIEAKPDGIGWTFHAVDAVTGNALSEADRRACAVHLLLKLADALAVPACDLAAVPYEAIAACHTANPLESRRVAMPRAKLHEHGFMATAPNIRRPATDFCAPPRSSARSRR